VGCTVTTGRAARRRKAERNRQAPAVLRLTFGRVHRLGHLQTMRRLTATGATRNSQVRAAAAGGRVAAKRRTLTKRTQQRTKLWALRAATRQGPRTWVTPPQTAPEHARHAPRATATWQPDLTLQTDGHQHRALPITISDAHARNQVPYDPANRRSASTALRVRIAGWPTSLPDLLRVRRTCCVLAQPHKPMERAGIHTVRGVHRHSHENHISAQFAGNGFK
jgi:hypothetical protein